jgi:hypothetical protein
VHARGDRRREVAHAALGHVVGVRQRLQRRVIEPDRDLTADDGDRRRHGAVRAHRLLDLARDAQVVGARQPVGDDRALQRDHRATNGQRVCDLGMDPHGGSP